VVPPPSLDLAPSVFQRQEPIYIQTFISQATVERFYLRVVRWLSGPAEIQLHTVSIRPWIQHLRNKLRAVVYSNRLWCLSCHCDPSQNSRHLSSADPWIHFDRQTFPRVVIHDRQGPQSPPVIQSIAYKIHRPTFIRSTRLDSCDSLGGTRVSSRPLPPQTLPFLLVQPVHPLVVHLPSFPPQQNVNPIVAIANPSFCQLPNPHP